MTPIASRQDKTRFVLIRQLGVGGQGQVFLADDLERGGRVAIKRLRERTSLGSLRFKAEFRAVSEVRHPALVRLYELGEDDDGLYFTMEPIDGVTLDGHLSLPLPRDLDRVLERFAPVMPQMLDALAALHGRGLVHRDLKPRNVMVDRSGAVKLLDFGILAAHGASADAIGTAEFMAPEQTYDVITPALDLYALGVILYWVLTGRLPSKREPPSRDSFPTSAPSPLVDACIRLLDHHPGNRPGLAWLDTHVLAPLGWPRMQAGAVVDRHPTAVLGRGEMLDRLSRSLPEEGSRFGAIVLRGPSGVGKTRLAEWMADEAERRGVLVFRGRARASERVPFNALDGAIDELAQIWSHDIPMPIGVGEQTAGADLTSQWITSASPVGSRHDDRVAALCQTAAAAFPVFGPPARAGRPPTRGEVFSAVASLLAEAARPDGLLLILDDLHWADDDSLALLDVVAHEAPAGVLVLGTVRDESEYAAVVARLTGADRRMLWEVPPLDAEVIRDLIVHTASRHGSTIEATTAAAVVEQCDGRPLLAEVVGRGLAAVGSSSPTLRPLDATLDRVSPAARAVLELLFVADDAMPVDALGTVLDQGPAAIDDVLALLAGEGLIRSHPRRGETFVDLYHDLVRVGVGGRLDDLARRARHDLLANYLAALGTRALPEQRARHLVGAGRIGEAGSLAIEAAERAWARSAFGLAAEMYEIAVAANTGDRLRLLRQRARCLEAAGRYADALGVWRELARLVDPAERRLIAIHEATSLLGCGDFRAGHASLERVMRLTGAPPLRSRGLGAIRDGLRFLIGPIGRRPRTTVGTPGDEALLTVAGKQRLAVFVCAFDPVKGMQFMLRTRDECDRIGAVEEAARCDYMLGALAYFRDGRRRPVPLAERYAASAAARLSAISSPGGVAAACRPALDAIARLRVGAFDRAEEALDRATSILDASSALTIEYLLLLRSRCMVQIARQNVRGLERDIKRLVAVAGAMGTGAMWENSAQYSIQLALLRGEHERARDIVRSLDQSMRGQPACVQIVLFGIIRCAADIGHDDPARLRRRIRRVIADDSRFGLLSSMDSATYWTAFAMIEARALLAGDPAASAREVDRYAARALRAPPFGASGALRARAYVREYLGDRAGAIRLLGKAEAEARRWGQRADLAVARHQRGKRLGGSEGERLRDDARLILVDIGAPGHWLDEDEVDFR